MTKIKFRLANVIAERCAREAAETAAAAVTKEINLAKARERQAQLDSLQERWSLVRSVRHSSTDEWRTMKRTSVSSNDNQLSDKQYSASVDFGSEESGNNSPHTGFGSDEDSLDRSKGDVPILKKRRFLSNQSDDEEI